MKNLLTLFIAVLVMASTSAGQIKKAETKDAVGVMQPNDTVKSGAENKTAKKKQAKKKTNKMLSNAASANGRI